MSFRLVLDWTCLSAVVLHLAFASPRVHGRDGRDDFEMRSWRIGSFRVFTETEPFRIAIHVNERPILAERARIDGSAIEFRTASGWHSVTRLISARREEAGASGLERPLVLEAEAPGGVSLRLRFRWLAPQRALGLRWELSGADVLAVRDDFVTDPGESFHGVKGGSPLLLSDRGPRPRELWILSSRGFTLRARATRGASVEAFFPDPDSLRIESRGSSLDLLLFPGDPRDTLPRILSLPSPSGNARAGDAGATGEAERGGPARVTDAARSRSVPVGFWFRFDRLPDRARRELLAKELARCGFPTPALVIQAGAAAVSLLGTRSGGLFGSPRSVPVRAFPRRLAETTDRWSELRAAVGTCLDRSLTGSPEWVSVSRRLLERVAHVKFSDPSTPTLPEGPIPRSSDPEFALRLLAVAAMQPLLCVDWDGGNSQFEVDDDTISTVRRYLIFQAALTRLANALSADETEGRLPLWRHLFVESPRDPVAWEVLDQWLYGRDVMVAPLLSPRASRRAVYFPAGTWVEIGRQDRRREIRGPKRVLIDVPPGEIGLFERRDGRWGVRQYLFEDELPIRKKAEGE